MRAFDKTEVGKRLRITREKLGINARTFAIKAGMDPSQLSKIEKGHGGISKKTMAKFVKAHNVNADYIMYGKHIPNNSILHEDSAEYQVPLRGKVDLHDALLSVLVSEVAGLRSAASGEHSEVIIKKIYKAAEDVVKLSKEE